MFPPYRPTYVAFVDDPTRRSKFRRHRSIQERKRDLPDQLSSQIKSSNPTLGSKRRHDEDAFESTLATLKRSRFELLGLSQTELDCRLLVEKRNKNDNAYTSPPVSPTKGDLIQVVATQANTTSDLTGRSAYDFSFHSSSEHRPSDRLSLVDTHHLDSPHGVFSFTAGSHLPQQVGEVTSLAVVKAPRNSLSVEDRKRFFTETPSLSLKMKMENWVSDVYEELQVLRSDGECWLHPCPPPPKPNGRAYGTIARRFSWRNGKSHTLTVNFGIVALALQGFLTEDQKEGFIDRSWHLSHLCGNWTCCNWRHHTVEPRITNVKRNACFRRDDGCEHQPPCMKHLKRRDLLPVMELVSDEVSVEGVSGA